MTYLCIYKAILIDFHHVSNNENDIDFETQLHS